MKLSVKYKGVVKMNLMLYKAKEKEAGIDELIKDFKASAFQF